ncbi:MAG: bifunctional glutamate N-acetyltransferase/amino-acid acetyltransferase ArgJ [Planctomycetaceae bacterium]|nr:bifunctional glutamate N-acetyltransferase/amino-acid acetyltransferase ArgJ [Planctomycetaceae bacterium]
MTQPKLPQGFSAAGVSCGIKVAADSLDLSLFVSDRDCIAAGVFTTNRVVGAPVIVSRSRVPATTVRAVVLNSGNSNACTGQRGIDDAEKMTALAGAHLNCAGEQVLVCSTGVIGRFLPMDKLTEGIPRGHAALDSTPEAFHRAARGMMTTDTVPKQISRTLTIQDQPVTVAGAAKGAAMIAPNMGTMLSVVMTDAAITAEQAQSMLRHAVNRSFNCISVDGHMSTSDTVLLLANGAAGASPASPEELAAFQQTLNEVCFDLSQKIIRDAEGAEHFVTIQVSGLPTRDEAFRIAKTVADSALVKTAITGNDPNWGRIVSAAGYANVPFREQDCTLIVNGFLLYESGRPVAFDEQHVSASMATGEVTIDLQFKLGAESVKFWTCDLTAEYVRLNADYTT